MALEFEAFVDGSARRPDGDFVLGGHIATAETWANFAKEWEELLPLAPLAKNGRRHFKMSEMAATKDGMAKTELFYRVIERHVLVSISYRMNIEEFERAMARIQSPTSAVSMLGVLFDFFKWENPYYFLFRALMDHFHQQGRKALQDLIPLTEKVDFYFDDQTEKSFILRGWADFVAEMPDDEIKQYYGATPRFENDQDFLPLQAADLWAWWVREWYEEDANHPPDRMIGLDFGKWQGKPRRLYVYSLNEQDIFSALQSLIFGQLALNEARGSLFPLAKKT